MNSTASCHFLVNGKFVALGLLYPFSLVLPGQTTHGLAVAKVKSGIFRALGGLYYYLLMGQQSHTQRFNSGCITVVPVKVHGLCTESVSV